MRATATTRVNSPDVVAELVERFGAIARSGEDLTVVYDAGQCSADNQELIADGAAALHRFDATV